ncbi:hypothetical protein SCOCK_630036 [Actinacidiphila cocklensis]|uniref:Uncharacterized protein n=1 Tax=Actinacidiphila cocklensis TaxID=887465 RepID=A0A9W4E2T3_9ACTN|nr:hypothetical protein SCOCK_630036 [Actinacidiphila cocklensis]
MAHSRLLRRLVRHDRRPHRHRRHRPRLQRPGRRGRRQGTRRLHADARRLRHPVRRRGQHPLRRHHGPGHRRPRPPPRRRQGPRHVVGTCRRRRPRRQRHRDRRLGQRRRPRHRRKGPTTHQLLAVHPLRPRRHRRHPRRLRRLPVAALLRPRLNPDAADRRDRPATSRWLRSGLLIAVHQDAVQAEPAQHRALLGTGPVHRHPSVVGNRHGRNQGEHRPDTHDQIRISEVDVGLLRTAGQQSTQVRAQPRIIRTALHAHHEPLGIVTLHHHAAMPTTDGPPGNKATTQTGHENLRLDGSTQRPPTRLPGTPAADSTHHRRSKPGHQRPVAPRPHRCPVGR